jgi:hypothetical protein
VLLAKCIQPRGKPRILGGQRPFHLVKHALLFHRQGHSATSGRTGMMRGRLVGSHLLAIDSLPALCGRQEEVVNPASRATTQPCRLSLSDEISRLWNPAAIEPRCSSRTHLKHSKIYSIIA